METKEKSIEEKRLDYAILLLKNTSAEIVDLVGIDCTILLLNQVVKSINMNVEYIKTGENRK